MLVRLIAAATLLSGTMVTASAMAAPGPGTFTRITSPSKTTVLHVNAGTGGTATHLTVSGKTSPDVTSVDVDCLYVGPQGSLTSTALASSVPVSAGAFSTVVNVANLTGQCRLRAIPTGTSTSDYLGSYTGPLIYTWTTGVVRDSGNVATGTIAADENGDGIAVYQDSGGDCSGVVLAATIEPPSMTVEGASGEGQCAVGLVSTNVTPSGIATASSLKVDGHNAYWPPMVAGYLISGLSLPVTQPALTVSFHHRPNGDLTMTVSGRLMRCSGGDTYPPTPTSCPSLVSTGVTYQRVVSFVDKSHQVRIADSFTSNGAKHKVSAQYQATLTPPSTGRSGYRFPGHSTTFHAVTSSQKVTGLGSSAGTILERSDLYAAEGDAQAATTAISYSRAPANILFANASGEPATSAMPYTLTVPAHGSIDLSMVVTNAVTTADAKKLASGAVGDFVVAPKVTAPHNGATVHGHKTTVAGKVSPGANGLPVAVAVNGHRARLTKSGSFTVSFSESFGKHTLKAVATDVAGSTKSSSITVTNKS